MIVHVRRVPRPNVEQPVEVAEGASVLALLYAAAIPPDAVVVLRDARPLPLDAPLSAGDRLSVVSVFSGG